MLDLRVLGPLQVLVAGAPRDITARKERQLLAVLTVSAGRQTSVDALSEALWPEGERTPANPAASLHVLALKVRRHLDDPTGTRLVNHRGGYTLELSGAELDAEAFRVAVREGRDAARSGDAERAVARLRAGLGLWRGAAYEDAETSAVALERTRLDELRTAALETLFETELMLGRHAAILGELDEAVEANRFHERFWALRMTALYRCGRQSEALSSYRDLRRITLDELGLEPTPELRRLELSLLEQSPSLDAADGPSRLVVPGPRQGAAPAVGPYGTLAPFLRATAERRMVGRERELSSLRALLGAATSRLRVGLVQGEPGAGKSRLVAELALETDAAGHVVVLGRCDDAPSSSYGPIAEMVRSLLAAVPRSRLEAALSDGVLAQLSALSTPLGAGGAARFPDTHPSELFEAVASLLELVAQDAPLLVVVEDIHWLDVPTAALLRYAARRLEGQPVAMLLSFRSDVAERTSSCEQLVAFLRRGSRVAEVTVGPLGVEEVGLLARSVLGRPLGAAVVAAVRDETGGNPLFVVELLRHLHEAEVLGDETADDDAAAVRATELPSSIRDLVEQRLGRLPERVQRLASIGAVIGREFDRDAVAHCLGPDAGDLDDGLAMLASAGLVHPLADVPGRHLFAHAIIQRAVDERLSPAARADLHGLVAQMLDDTGSGSAAQRALHHFQAASRGGIEQALASGIEAAQEARRALAFDDSVAILRRTLGLADARGSVEQRTDVMLHLGDAHWWAGDVDHSQEVFAEALLLLRRHGLAHGELFARAVLGRWRHNGAATQGFSAAEPDDELIDTIDEALEGLTTFPSLRAALLGRLGIASYWTVPIERRREIADSAVALARAAGDDGVLLDVLVQRQLTLWAPGSEPQRLEHSAEILVLARRLGQTAREADARIMEAVDHLALGDLAAADTAIRRALRVSASLRQPFYRWHSHFLPALRALMDGRFEEASSLTAGAIDDGESEGAEGAFALSGLQTLWLLFEQGQLPQIAPILEEVAGNFGEIPAMDAARTWVLAEAGEVDQARARLDDLVFRDFDIARTDIAWLAAMCLLASSAATLGHVAASARLHEILLPFSGRNALVWVGMCCGPVDHYLGRLQAVLGDPVAAALSLERAAEMAAAMRARPWALRIAVDRARIDPSGHGAALEELAAEAAALGMAGVAGEARELIGAGDAR